MGLDHVDTTSLGRSSADGLRKRVRSPGLYELILFGGSGEFIHKFEKKKWLVVGWSAARGVVVVVVVFGISTFVQRRQNLR